jgi:hypothetical protein
MPWYKVLTAIILVLLISYTAMTYAANKRVERQPYKVIKSANGFEIRYYPKAIMATITTKGDSYMGGSSSNFRTLAGYIFGGNRSSEKIAMTAPVHIEKSNSESKMSFVMPSDYTLDKLPAPNDSKVDLHYSKEGYFAVLKFGGYANEQKIQRKIGQLKDMLIAGGYKVKGAYSYLGYNAPWDVVGRENEVIVEIEYTGH